MDRNGIISLFGIFILIIIIISLTACDDKRIIENNTSIPDTNAVENYSALDNATLENIQ